LALFFWNAWKHERYERYPTINIVSLVFGRNNAEMPNIHMVNGNSYQLPYRLVDGIYPNWPVFMKTIPNPQGPARKSFAKVQEECTKDIERAFGVLQKRFAIARNPARSRKPERLKMIMTTCIILHNMIVEDQRTAREQVIDEEFDEPHNIVRFRGPNQRQRRQIDFQLVPTEPVDLPSGAVASLVSRIKAIRDRTAYF
jgi:hypothetical protein